MPRYKTPQALPIVSTKVDQHLATFEEESAILVSGHLSEIPTYRPGTVLPNKKSVTTSANCRGIVSIALCSWPSNTTKVRLGNESIKPMMARFSSGDAVSLPVRSNVGRFNVPTRLESKRYVPSALTCRICD